MIKKKPVAALYSEQVNRYAELYAEGEFYKDLAGQLRGELEELGSLSREVTAAAFCLKSACIFLKNVI